MNESSSSMRIIRGIPLHVNFVDNLPSFSMGLTQDFGVDVGSMVKSKQVQHEQTMEELRAKKKYDPTAVQEVINNAKARGIKIVQGGRKRKAVNIDSEENACEVDGSEEHHNYEVFISPFSGEISELLFQSKTTRNQCFRQSSKLDEPANNYRSKLRRNQIQNPIAQFSYMAISDERQRIMPTAQDRAMGRQLDYKEAVLLTGPSTSFLKGEVDDKYQYSVENKDNKVHGWISPSPKTGFWMITPSSEFQAGGPVKQDLTSHTGPITLSMFFSTHYAGEIIGLRFRNGEPWKKVFGPIFIYLNSVPNEEDILTLWTDAKEQMLIETEKWPYEFPLSQDFVGADQRGIVCGRLLVNDSYMSKTLITPNSTFIGLAAPGDVGSWQIENKGYQFWTQTNNEGYFFINNIIPGNYSLYAWVPGFIGDYKYKDYISIIPGSRIRLQTLVYYPPRNGPTLWEIGIPDRTAEEFFIPNPQPKLQNQLCIAHYEEKFRQYGLWDRYTEIYPNNDLIYIVGSSNYQTDWFFAHVNKYIYKDNGDKTYIPTTWQIVFDLQEVKDFSNYTLQLALASSNEAELQIRINDQNPEHAPHFTTGSIGKDNAIARHGIHGLYRMYSIDIPSDLLTIGSNTMFLKQSRGSSSWSGLMYDYIRLEGPLKNE
ncbi:uncharacterized protein LOC107029989 [Solanum pennellii]|uniref:rhamnogalacturonan endolyase n=1 Tax=Solanum pennellii TaxID=28526 RepID=A0ABM1HKT1_SOLPN|nr:uncharacterized protein LOC107029989 [Solanum pennellii]